MCLMGHKRATGFARGHCTSAPVLWWDRRGPVEQWRIWDLKMWVGLLAVLSINLGHPRPPPPVQQNRTRVVCSHGRSI